MNFMLLASLAIVATLSVARTTRLIIFDEYPPMKWLRNKWDQKVTGGWNTLLHCGFCAAPYVAVGMTLWIFLAFSSGPSDMWSDVWWWWVINTTWGFSYVASIIVAYDQPED